MIQCYKIFNGIVRMKTEDMFTLIPPATTRSTAFGHHQRILRAESNQPYKSELLLSACDKGLERSTKKSCGGNISQRLQEQIRRMLEAPKIRNICCMKM